MVDIFGKRKYLASCTTYGSLTKTRVVRWVFFVFVSGTRYILVLSYGSKDAELERLNGCLQHLHYLVLVCVDTYVSTLSLTVVRHHVAMGEDARS